MFRPILSVFPLLLLIPSMGAREVLKTGFEQESWAAPWKNARSANVKIVSPGDKNFVPREGKALRVRIPKGSFYGTELSYFFKDHLKEEPEEAYFAYDLRLCEDWSTSQSGKLPGFAGTYGKSGWGGKPSDGSTGWSARGLFTRGRTGEGVRIGNYVYHAEMKGQYGDHFRWDKSRKSLLKPGKWVRVAQHLRLNTPGKSDGEMKAWVDGTLVMHQKKICFRKTPALKIERLWMDVYHGGKTPAAKDLYLDFDNVVIHTGPPPRR